jgi:small subunit ribosomal protein S17
MSEQQQKNKRLLQGVVTSNKMDKTIVVLVESKVKHPVYGKYIKRSTKVSAHDPENQCREGDIVIVAESRPISKNKNWVLSEIVESNKK